MILNGVVGATAYIDSLLLDMVLASSWHHLLVLLLKIRQATLAKTFLVNTEKIADIEFCPEALFLK